MLISEKQHTANLENAEKSTGPQTPEGIQASKFNALKYGIAARSVLLPFEDSAEFQAIWEEFHAEWQPATPTERHYFDRMIVAHWLLARVCCSESTIYCEPDLAVAERLHLLNQVARQRVTLERSFNSAVAALRSLQQARKSETQIQPRPAKPAKESSARPLTGYPQPVIPMPLPPPPVDSRPTLQAASDTR